MISADVPLREFLGELSGAPWVAVDTEADSLYTYPERLCLIQVSIPGRDVLVDPLAVLDLGPLWSVLGHRTLILHGADYDLRLLHRTAGFIPAAVFDTMIAARLLGFAEFGLERLADRMLGVRLDKGPQRANWSRRPLTERMIAYAINDTRYLEPIAGQLGRQLRERDRLSWHTEMCARLVTDSTAPRTEDPDLVWRLAGSDRLDRRGMGILRALYFWREGEARAASRPPYFVLAHETLVRVAGLAASTGRMPEGEVPPRMHPARRRRLTATVQEALALPESALPHRRHTVGHRLTMAQKKRYEGLRQRRDLRARALGLDPSLIASRAVLLGLAAEQEPSERLLMAWQRQLLEV